MTLWLRLPAILPALLAGQAAGADAAAGVNWRCWYDQEVHVTCLIESVSDTAMIATLPAPIPAIAEEIRRDFGPGQKFYIHIPLHTRPRRAEFTAELARASVCGEDPACNVDFSMEPPSAEEMEALIGEDLPAADGPEEL